MLSCTSISLQARETLRVMMERQKQQRLETADKLNKYVFPVLGYRKIHSVNMVPEIIG